MIQVSLCRKQKRATAQLLLITNDLIEQFLRSSVFALERDPWNSPSCLEYRAYAKPGANVMGVIYLLNGNPV